MNREAKRLELDPPLPFDEAERLVREHAKALAQEECELRGAAGRVLARAVSAPHDVPPFQNSMVDGYAVLAADVAQATSQAPVHLEVLRDVAAGESGDVELSPGRAVRIMTGAPVPASADAIVMLEWTEWSENSVTVFRPTAPGRFIRRAGEDMAAGEIVLEVGHRLGPAEIGILASIGMHRVPVYRRPRVAVLATGDELLEVHEPLAPGKIRSSNQYTISGQAADAGCEVVDLGIARDDDEDLARRIAKATGADVLITSGGVSVGDRDRVQPVLKAAGFEKVFWRVASSPGKPLLFGRLGRCLVFGLPGNPVSSMVAFENFVRPTLLALQGIERTHRARAVARAATDLSGPEDRRHFARVRVSFVAEGLEVREVGPHGSGNLRSMVNANGLAVIPEGRSRINAGEPVEVLLLGDPDSEE